VSKRSIKLKGLDALGQWREAPAIEPEAETPTAEVGGSTKTEETTSAAGTWAIDVEAMLTELASADDALARLQSQDEAKRASMHDHLERYDALTAMAIDVKRAVSRACGLREQAEALAAGAFGDETRDAAKRIADLAARVAERAAQEVMMRRAEADHFAAQHDLMQTLVERRRRRFEEAERARAAQTAKAERLAEALAAARKALAASQLKEARELLGDASNDNPGSAEVASLLAIIAQRERESKAALAEDALWLARYEWRHEPRRAVERLAGLDVDGLPEQLAGWVFGGWVQACVLLCRREGYLDPLRYTPSGLGRGAVIARTEPGGPYVVVSALGLPEFPPPGSPIPTGVIGWARPLT
jgi:hypothetical protein